MKKFIKYEFPESHIHQQLLEILINKYKIKTYEIFEKERMNNNKFQGELQMLYDSYEDFINNDI